MFRDLMQLQNRMNRLFDESYPQRRQEEDFFSGPWTPAVDIYEKQDAIVLKADLPDMKPDDIDIRIENNTLTLHGERKFEKEVKEENFHRIERSYGTFTRSFALPHTVTSEDIEANYKNGVLSITIPKKEESRPRQIKISPEEASSRGSLGKKSTGKQESRDIPVEAGEPELTGTRK